MAVNTDKLEFDPNLNIPVGLKYAGYIEVDELDIDDIPSDMGPDSTNDEELEPPSFMEIVSQTLKTAKDGREVVDVVLNIEDIEGAVKYDVRITKR